MIENRDLQEDALAWLLAADVPGVRFLALRDLLRRPADDPELRDARRAAHVSGPIAATLAQMDPQGYWAAPVAQTTSCPAPGARSRCCWGSAPGRPSAARP